MLVAFVLQEILFLKSYTTPAVRILAILMSKFSLHLWKVPRFPKIEKGRFRLTGIKRRRPPSFNTKDGRKDSLASEKSWNEEDESLASSWVPAWHNIFLFPAFSHRVEKNAVLKITHIVYDN